MIAPTHASEAELRRLLLTNAAFRHGYDVAIKRVAAFVERGCYEYIGGQTVGGPIGNRERGEQAQAIRNWHGQFRVTK